MSKGSRRPTHAEREAAERDAFEGVMLRRPGPLGDWGLRMLQIAGLRPTLDPDELEQHGHALCTRMRESVGEPHKIPEASLRDIDPKRLMSMYPQRNTLYMQIMVGERLAELLVPMPPQVVFDIRQIQRVANTDVLQGSKVKLSTRALGWATTMDRGYTTSARRSGTDAARGADAPDETVLYEIHPDGTVQVTPEPEFNAVGRTAVVEWADASAAALARAALASVCEKRHYNVHFEYDAALETYAIHAQRAHGNPHHVVQRSQRGARAWPITWIGAAFADTHARTHRGVMGRIFRDGFNSALEDM